MKCYVRLHWATVTFTLNIWNLKFKYASSGNLLTSVIRRRLQTRIFAMSCLDVFAAVRSALWRNCLQLQLVWQHTHTHIDNTNNLGLSRAAMQLICPRTLQRVHCVRSHAHRDTNGSNPGCSTGSNTGRKQQTAAATTTTTNNNCNYVCGNSLRFASPRFAVLRHNSVAQLRKLPKWNSICPGKPNGNGSELTITPQSPIPHPPSLSLSLCRLLGVLPAWLAGWLAAF